MTQKRPRHTPEASGLTGLPLGNPPDAAPFCRLQGLSYATLSGSRGSVARQTVLSNGFVEPNESPLACLENSSRQPVPRKVELGYCVAVELDAALRDQPSRLARRQAKCVGE